MTTEAQPLFEIPQEALRDLYRESGLVDTARFLNQITTGLGNYTEERRAMLENMSLDEALAAVREYQAERQSTNQQINYVTPT